MKVYRDHIGPRLQVLKRLVRGGNPLKNFVNEIGKDSYSTGEKKINGFRQKSGIEIQRGNAVSIRGTVERSRNFDDDPFLLGFRRND